MRAGFRTDLLHSQRAVGLEEARAVAGKFKRTLMQALGGVEEMPLNPGGE